MLNTKIYPVPVVSLILSCQMQIMKRVTELAVSSKYEQVTPKSRRYAKKTKMTRKKRNWYP